MDFKAIYRFAFLLSLALASQAEPYGQHQHIDPFLTITDFAQVRHAVFSPDGKIVLTVSENQDIKLWDTATGQYIHGLFRPFTDDIRYAEFSPDGTRILFFGSESLVAWDIWRGNWLLFFEGHHAPISSAHYSPDGNYILSTGYDETIKIWDANNGELVKNIYRQFGLIDAVFGPDNTIVGVDGQYPWASVSSWDWYGHLLSTSFLKDSAWPVLTDEAHVIEPGTATAKTENTIACPGHSDPVVVPVVTPPVPVSPPWVPIVREALGQLSKAGNYFGNIANYHPFSSAQFILWVAERQNPTKEVFVKSDALIKAFSFSKDEQYVVIASIDGTASIYRTLDGEKLLQLHGHTASVNSAYFSDDGRWLITASDDKTVRFWDVSSVK